MKQNDKTDESLEKVVSSLDELIKLYQDDLKKRADIDDKKQKQSTEDVKFVLSSLDQIKRKLETSQATQVQTSSTSDLTQVIVKQDQQIQVLESQYQTQLTLLSLLIVLIAIAVLYKIGALAGTFFKNIFY